VGLAPRGQGGRYVEDAYDRLLGASSSSQASGQALRRQPPGSSFPVNTHGGLLGQGAPWEAPALFSLVEAVAQLRGEAEGRQVAGASRALVYANGGVFSASAVVILERCGAAAGAAGAASKL
jgi:acetyl-CoA acetyltransferase